MTFEEIRALLPQRFPFLMVDRVLSIEEGKRMVAIKNITGNEIFFLGHFSRLAVLPAVLIIESMAQAAIILFRKSYGAQLSPIDDDESIFVLGATKARFFRPVFPGDQLQLDITIVKTVSTGGIVEAAASVAGHSVSTAHLTFGIKRLAEFQNPRP